MMNEEIPASKDRFINQEETDNSRAMEEQTETVHSVVQANSGSTEAREEATKLLIAGEKNQAKGMVFFHLLVPIVLVTLIYYGGIWYWIYIDYWLYTKYSLLNDLWYAFLSLLIGFTLISPLYLLLVLISLRKKHLSAKNIIISSIVIFCIWLYYLATLNQKSVDLRIMLNWLYVNAGPMLSIIAVLFTAALIFKACFVILRYEKSKRSVKKDYIFCTTLLVIYSIICIFFISEGGLIYILPYREEYTVTEDFPSDKRAVLKSLYKFATLARAGNKPSVYKHEKQISYEDLLTMASSQSLLSPESMYHSYPKLYVKYWTNNVISPISKDLLKRNSGK